MKNIIATILISLLPVIGLAVLDRGWILYKDKTPVENLTDASNLLVRINAYFPQTSKYSGKVFPYWMKDPASVMHYINVTNIYEETNIIGSVEIGSVTNITVVTNVVIVPEATGQYLIYVKPSIVPLLTPMEKSAVVDVLPEGCFVQEEQ